MCIKDRLYSLPSRDLITDSVEYMVNAHCADAMICISNGDKITPGMLMAALRINIPVVFVSGGPMEAGKVAWINPRHAEIDGIRTVKRLKDLDWVPDLVVITAPAAIVPQVVRTAAERGVQAAIILTAHLGEGPGSLSAQVDACPLSTSSCV